MAERSFGPVVVRRRLGSELRRLRDRAGLSLEQVARELEVSPSKISRLETGQSPAKVWDVRNLLTLYGVEDEDYRRRAERWVNEGKSQGWWHPYSDAISADLDHYIALEAEASEIKFFAAYFLYGLVQTEAYARAMLQATHRELDASAVDGLVRVRMGRQAVLRDPGGPSVQIILDESVLWRYVGSREAMREQWERLLELPSKVALRIRPLDAEPHVAVMSSFTIFHPRESSIDPAVVNLESAFHDSSWEDHEEVARFSSAFEELKGTSLHPDESRETITRLLREGRPGER